MTRNTITKIFWAAGLFNIGAVLLFSQFFTNPYPAKYYPGVFSDFGLIVIILWGMTYISVSSLYMYTRNLMILFAIEKLAYTLTWVYFLMRNGAMLPDIFNESFMTGLMFSSYGSIDFAFGCFFLWVWISGYKITE